MPVSHYSVSATSPCESRPTQFWFGNQFRQASTGFVGATTVAIPSSNHLRWFCRSGFSRDPLFHPPPLSRLKPLLQHLPILVLTLRRGNAYQCMFGQLCLWIPTLEHGNQTHRKGFPGPLSEPDQKSSTGFVGAALAAIPGYNLPRRRG